MHCHYKVHLLLVPAYKKTVPALDYPGIGPMHANLYDSGRGMFLSATDEEALQASFEVAKLEGIIPALETAHAFSALNKMKFNPNDNVVICLSGRGDKDLATYMKAMGSGSGK